MEESLDLARIQQLLRRGAYRLTGHAEREREADKVTAEDLEEAISSDRAGVIERYAGDPRGRSCLVLGFDKKGWPLHVVCGLEPELVIVITVYRPDPEQWVDWKTRKKS